MNAARLLDPRRWPRTLWLVLAVGLAIIIPFLLWGEAIEAWFGALAADASRRAALGWALFGLLALDIVLPVPSSLASTLCGVVFGLWGGFAISFGAMTVSAALGYAIGRLFAGWARRLIGARENALLRLFLRRHGPPALIALRTVPVLAEASVLFAGLGRMRPWRAAWPLLAGNAAVSLIYALVGAWGHRADAMLPAFLGSLALSGLFWLAARRLTKRAPAMGAERTSP